jgi:hypothetical protein
MLVRRARRPAPPHRATATFPPVVLNVSAMLRPYPGAEHGVPDRRSPIPVADPVLDGSGGPGQEGPRAPHVAIVCEPSSPSMTTEASQRQACGSRSTVPAGT